MVFNIYIFLIGSPALKAEATN